MKSRIIIILTLITCLFSGCNNNKIVDNKQESKGSTPIFYAITKPEANNTIYLLGSIHAADETAYPLNEKIIKAFNDSTYLAVEVNINELNNNLSEQIELAQKMLYIDNTTIKDHLGDELYNSMVESLKEKNSYNQMYDNYKPMFFESLFENLIINDADMNSNDGIDMYFLKLAEENSKQILEIESASYQYDLLLSIPEELSKMNIKNYIDDYDTSVEDMRNLYEAWKKGNLEELNGIIFEETEEDLTEEEQKLIDNYNNSLISDRNYNMSNKLQEYFKDGKDIFCVVGLAHIIGEDGIANLLEKDGFIVEQIKYD